MSKLPVSVCIISGAEVQRIGRALESVAEWAGEIIVVMNEEVHDGTEEIALRHGAKVFREPWKGFIAQKNSAATKASLDWLLDLDADEAVSPELRGEISRLTSQPDRAGLHAAYDFPRQAFYCGRWIRHGEWYPDRCLRLWQRGTAEWGGADPHAKLAVRGTIGKLRGDLLHYTTQSINWQVTKTVQYADTFAKNRLAQGRGVTAFDLAVRPVWRFLRGYVFRLGFLDGWQGFAIAWMTAFYTFLRYVRVRESQLPKNPND